MTNARSKKKVLPPPTLPAAKDLVVLVADQDAEQSMKSLLLRCNALHVRPFSFEVFRHIGRDPGCFGQCHDFLRPFHTRYSHALVVFDLHGSGREGTSRDALESETESRLSKSGWQTRAAAVVLAPELEIWVWSDSPHVSDILGWRDMTPPLNEWLTERGYLSENSVKPEDPKTAFLEALRKAQKPRSASLFAELAQKVGVDRCKDPAFLKLRRTLALWFPIPGANDAEIGE